MQKNLAFWLATWLGSGLMKPAPGTWGSAAAIPFGLIIFGAAGLWGLLIAIFVVGRIGIWAANEFDRQSGSHDNKMIVIDEVAGQWIALIPALALYGLAPLPIAISFALFRVFDILKPWPVSYCDRNIKGGLGVMADDFAAGIYAALLFMGLELCRTWLNI